MTEEELRMSIGAYLLDALEPAEALEVQAHLPHCAECQKEYLELTEVLPALATLSRDSAERPSPDGDTPAGHPGRRRAPRQVEDEQRRPRRVWLAAAAVVLTAVPAGISALSRDSPTPRTGTGTVEASPAMPSVQPAVRTVTGTNAVTRVRLTATLRPGGTGTLIRADLTGGPSGTRCHLRAATRADGRQNAGVAVRITDQGRAIWTNGAVPTPMDQIDRLEVVDELGNIMVTAPP